VVRVRPLEDDLLRQLRLYEAVHDPSAGGEQLGERLAARRGVVNRLVQPKLTEEIILAWADTHHRLTGRWPTVKSGPVHGVAGETWAAIDNAMKIAIRGFVRPSSLAQLLAARRGVRNPRHPPRLTEEMILGWADAHHRKTGKWPNVKTGRVDGARAETWMALDPALQRKTRGLQKESSLAKLLELRRGTRNPKALPKLTEEQILAWADAYHRRVGDWPKVKSGRIDGTNGETWATVDNTLTKGGRGLPGGSSLCALLYAHRGESYHCKPRHRKKKSEK